MTDGGSTARRQSRGRLWAVRSLKLGAAAVLVTAAAGPALFFGLNRAYPFPTELLGTAVSAEVLAHDGAPLASRVGPDDQWRRPIPLGSMGRWLPLATVAIEDERFRSHLGVDPKSVVRAAATNLWAGRVRQGASTLTMQLIDMAGRTPPTLGGKAREAFRALQLERLLTKDEILERYLNLAPYGGNLLGVNAAAAAWFGAAPADLALHEAALLAGLPQGPSRLRPDRHPERARRRRTQVLDAMVRTGLIDEAAATRAEEAPLPKTLRSIAAAGGPTYLHATAWALGIDPSGGTLSLEPGVQEPVAEVVARHRSELPPGTDISAVVIDIAAASLVAHVGSADPLDPVDGQVDGARSLRSPGSTLKPFIFGAAMEKGALRPNSLISDEALNLDDWSPANFDDEFHGEVTVQDALRRSLNLPALRAAQIAGLPRCIGVLEAAGIRLPEGTLASSGLSLVTGGTEVRLIDLTSAYAALGRGGQYLPTRLFTGARSTSRTPVQVLSPEVCASLNQILSDAERTPKIRGGASHVGGVGFMWKTGTSSGHRDAWAIGHGKGYAIGIWVGRFDGAGHPAYTGRHAAEPILAELFAALPARE